MAYSSMGGQGQNQLNKPPVPTAAQPTNRSLLRQATGAIGGGVNTALAPMGLTPQKQTTPALPPHSTVPPVAAFNAPGSIQNPNKTPGTDKNGYNPTTAPFGYDMSAPGVREQFWNQNQGKWFDTPGADWVDTQLPQFETPWQGELTGSQIAGTIAQPGAGQQYWNGVQGQANTMTGAEKSISGGYKGANNAESAFNLTGTQLPGSLQPQFDAYYDRMKQKAMSDVNAQGAARGSYGSNASLNNSIGAGLDIEAARAKAATDFALDDSANQRQWLDSYANQGRNADLSGQGAFGLDIEASKYGLDKTETLGDLAFKAEQMDFDKKKESADLAFDVDDHRLERVTTGMDAGLKSDELRGRRLNDAFGAAGDTQNAREDRVNNLFGAQKDLSNDVIQFAQENWNELMNADGTLNEQAIEALIAKTGDERGWNEQQREVFARDLKSGAEAIAAIKGMK